MLSGLVHGYNARRKDYFQTHVEPLQQMITTVHKDYVVGFEKARNHLRDDSAPPEQLFEFLRERRRDYVCDRQLARDLASELQKVSKSGIKGDTWRAVEQYCNSIIRYFSAGASVSGYSWYTDFLNNAQSLAKFNLSSGIWFTSAISGNPRSKLLQQLDYILDEELPGAFADVSKSYAQLKAP